ncbi:TraR/DksA C4-type zinc finger protein [Patescibacteria group bacterium]|nr:TraR/DksA C4-type zinc finger protein [Patescibacteria group bacterium]MCG2701518.1 TraR/DksA C4-type zinc finger protein [Candidatus Parcubacteria bacterium]MBU4209811.1 TraR/DksA C4-type zinc finger protein [Patescibacteria group bacterium]MBU4265279.1 TraR/DksA C4-type zinc finger protein [Patescibacteria group bacterium]MBU4389964.1 TraR/DksA C4-type zinc finger protein [Patescibacteria group bacterium]
MGNKRKNKKNRLDIVKFPVVLLSPIKKFLEKEIEKLRKRKDEMEKDDPFRDESRTSNNSLEEDLDEQLGHFESEVKVKFLLKQMIQFRKALSRLRIGKYGICEGCAKMIDTDRLAIKPEATFCIKCEKERM